MEQNKKISLRDEVNKDAEIIEQEIQNNPELEDIKVSAGAKDALWAKIQAYEKERAGRSENVNNDVEFSAELVPNFSECTNDNPEILLSEEDKEALRLGRELLKQKKEENLHEVNTEFHKHLNTEDKSGTGHNGKGARVYRMPKKKRVLFAFVAVLVLVVGIGVTSVGSKSYLKELWDKVSGNDTVQVVNVKDMETKASEFDNTIDIFKNVSNELGINAVRFGELPTHMSLVQYEIDKEQERAVLLYQYNGESIRYTIYLNDSDSSLGQKQTDVLTDEYVVETAEQDVNIREFKVKKSDRSRYIADFKHLGVNYQVKGIMERAEFDELIKKLTFF